MRIVEEEDKVRTVTVKGKEAVTGAATVKVEKDKVRAVVVKGKEAEED